jgi:hypothetical protein
MEASTLEVRESDHTLDFELDLLMKFNTISLSVSPLQIRMVGEMAELRKGIVTPVTYIQIAF